MWNRQDLKLTGKNSFRITYWKSVLAGILAALAAGASVPALSIHFYPSEDTAGIQNVFPSGWIIAGVTVGLGASLLISIFLLQPLGVGARRFFMVDRGGHTGSPSELLYAFKSRYGNIVLTMLLKNLFQFLWFLLIVPGFIFTYAYRLVPYLLAEDPDMDPMTALRTSKEMMRGQKWRVFVLDLSFFWWFALTALTGGIVGIFYVYPYYYATDAELYAAIRCRNTGGYAGM